MSNDSDTLGKATQGIALIGEVLKAAGDSPNVKAAGAELGKSALTVTKTINNVLLPLAAVNFAFDKAREYFAEQFQKDLGEKVASIPPEHVVDPKASVAGPTLQGLAFAHDEDALRDMYLNLLATSMDGRAASSAHPAFVEIIKQLEGEEARLLSPALQDGGGIPIAEIRLIMNEKGHYQLLYQHLLPLVNEGTPIEQPRLSAMVDNWVRLGLVTVDYSKVKTAEGAYSWVEERPEYIRLKELHEKNGLKLEFKKGLLVRTALGAQFAAVVGIVLSDRSGNR